MSTSRAQARSDAQQEAIAKRQSGGSARKRESPAPAAPAVDEETAAALTLFNTYLAADRERQEHERAVRKAEKAKDDAAAAVRKLNDRKAPAAKTAAAEAAYREAMETLKRVRDGETAAGADDSDDDETAAGADEDGEGPASTEATEHATDDNATDDNATDDATETAADDEEAASVGVEAPVGDDDLAGDEPASVTG